MLARTESSVRRALGTPACHPSYDPLDTAPRPRGEDGSGGGSDDETSAAPQAKRSFGECGLRPAAPGTARPETNFYRPLSASRVRQFAAHTHRMADEGELDAAEGAGGSGARSKGSLLRNRRVVGRGRPQKGLREDPFAPRHGSGGGGGAQAAEAGSTTFIDFTRQAQKGDGVGTEAAAAATVEAGGGEAPSKIAVPQPPSQTPRRSKKTPLQLAKERAMSPLLASTPQPCDDAGSVQDGASTAASQVSDDAAGAGDGCVRARLYATVGDMKRSVAQRKDHSLGLTPATDSDAAAAGRGVVRRESVVDPMVPRTPSTLLYDRFNVTGVERVYKGSTRSPYARTKTPGGVEGGAGAGGGGGERCSTPGDVSPPREVIRVVKKPHWKKEDYTVASSDRRGSQPWVDELTRVCGRLRPGVTVDDASDPSTMFHFLQSIRGGAERFAYAVPGEYGDLYSLRVHAVPESEVPKVRRTRESEVASVLAPFLVSSKGVTYTEPDVGPTDFTPMEEWLYEYERYKLVKTVRLFSVYKMWRVFRLWRSAVMMEKMRASSDWLCEHHMALNAEWSLPLMTVKAACEDISQLCFVKISPETCTLKEFATLQEEQAAECRTSVAALVTQIHEVAHRACTFAGQPVFASELHGLIGTKHHPGLNDYHSQTLEKWNQRAILRRRRGFVRVCDMMLKAALAEMCKRAFCALRELLTMPSKARDSEVLIALMVSSGILTKKYALASEKVILQRRAGAAAEAAAAAAAGSGVAAAAAVAAGASSPRSKPDARQQKAAVCEGDAAAAAAGATAGRKAMVSQRKSATGTMLRSRAAGATVYAAMVAYGGTVSEADVEYVPVLSLDILLEEDTGATYPRNSTTDLLAVVDGIRSSCEGVVGEVVTLASQDEFKAHLVCSDNVVDNTLCDAQGAAAVALGSLREAMGNIEGCRLFQGADAACSPVRDKGAVQAMIEQALGGEEGEEQAAETVLEEDAEARAAVGALPQLKGDEEYARLVRAVPRAVRANMEALAEKLAMFKKYTDIYVYNRNLDLEQLRQSEAHIGRFYSLLAEMRKQGETVQGMPAACQVGIFAVSLASVKDMIVPAPAIGCAKVSQLVPVMLRAKNMQMLAGIQMWVKRLSSPLEVLEDLAVFIESHDACLLEIENVEHDFEIVKRYVTLMEKEDITCPPDDLKLWQHTTNPAMEQLKKCLLGSDRLREVKTAEFSVVIDTKLEEFTHTFEGLKERANNKEVFAMSGEPEDRLRNIQELQDTVKSCEKEVTQLCLYQELFGLEVTRPTIVVDVVKDVSDKVTVWSSFIMWKKLRASWEATPFRTLDTASVQAAVHQCTKVVSKATRVFSFNYMVLKFRVMVDEIKLVLPLVDSLKNPDLRAHHIRELERLLGSDAPFKAPRKERETRDYMEASDTPSSPSHQDIADPECTLGRLLALSVCKHKESIVSLSLKATSEEELEQQLVALDNLWALNEFQLTPIEGATRGVPVVQNADELRTSIDDTCVQLSLILTSRSCSTYLSGKAEAWRKKMDRVAETLRKWVVCQEHWIYLGAVFSNSDVVWLWPQEARAFSAVNKDFKECIGRLSSDPYVVRAVLQSDVFGGVDIILRMFEKLHSALGRNLDTTRSAFPRFFFLSDAELLDLVSHSKSPTEVVKHMSKAFDNLSVIHVTDGIIVAIQSCEGEVLELCKGLRAKKNADKWMERLEEIVCQSLRKNARRCYYDHGELSLKLWMRGPHQSQLVLSVYEMSWCARVEAELGQPTNLSATTDATSNDVDLFSKATRENASRLHKRCVQNLLITAIHHRDVTAALVAAKASSVTDFHWKKVLRTYWDESGLGISLSQLEATHQYGYEFVGCYARLVVTPLTERVLLTVSAATIMHMGTAPTGPAGTGKTETIKDLSRRVARLCIVYNCSEGVTYKMTERLFSGLCQAGVWCCLDEFNRISYSVLSVIAQQLHDARSALLTGTGIISIKGRNVVIKSTFATFVTMNWQYSARNALPESVKAYFRPVAVLVSDTFTIVNVLLCTREFTLHEALARKICKLYELASDHVARRVEYDFGMRSIKSMVLQAAEAFHERQAVQLTPTLDDVARLEEKSVASACWQSIAPRLVQDDSELLCTVMTRLFRRDVLEELAQEEVGGGIQTPLMKVLVDQKLQVQLSLKKAVQCVQALNMRCGVILLGEAGTGKTQVGQALATLYNVTQRVLCPRSVTYQELLGSLDPKSNKWTDGILSLLFASDNADAMWIVFDGIMNSWWVETLNSLLDSTRTLCLSSGHSIKAPDRLRVLFETDSVEDISPATATRCGIVHFDRLPLFPVAQTWIKNEFGTSLPTVMLVHLQRLFKTMFIPIVEPACRDLLFATSSGSVTRIGLLNAIFSIMAALLRQGDIELAVEKSSRARRGAFGSVAGQALGTNEFNTGVATLLFVYSVLWGIGGNLDEASEGKFDEMVKRLCSEVGVTYAKGVPMKDQLPDFGQLVFVRADKLVPEFAPKEALTSADLPRTLVPTPHTTKFLYLLNVLCLSGASCHVTGPTGAGKTALLRAVKDGVAQDSSSLFMVLCGETKTERMRAWLGWALRDQAVEQRQRCEGEDVEAGDSSRRGKRGFMTLVLEDVNMPDVSEKEPVVQEWLRHLLQHKAYFAAGGASASAENIRLLCSSSTGSSITRVVSARLTRLLVSVHVPHPEEDEMLCIIDSVLRSFFHKEGFAAEVSGLAHSIGRVLLEVLEECRSSFPRQPSKPHHTFSLHNVAAVLQGILLAVPYTCASVKTAALLVIHETARCFADRLSSAAEHSVCQQVTRTALQRWLPPGSWSSDVWAGEWPLLYGDFLRPDAQAGERVYEAVKEPGHLVELLEYYADDLSDGTDNLVFFKENCVQVTKVMRALLQVSRHTCLVGVTGCGRRTLTRLAAMIHEFEFFSLQSSDSYTATCFHTDLVQLFDTASEEQDVVLFLTDAQLNTEGIAEDVRYLVEAGELPYLISQEERTQKVATMRAEASDADEMPQTDEERWVTYWGKVRRHLRLVLSLTPSSKLLTVFHSFPSLVECGTLVWFDAWPRDALQLVAERVLADAAGDDTATTAPGARSEGILTDEDEDSDEVDDDDDSFETSSLSSTSPFNVRQVPTVFETNPTDSAKPTPKATAMRKRASSFGDLSVTSTVRANIPHPYAAVPDVGACCAAIHEASVEVSMQYAADTTNLPVRITQTNFFEMLHLFLYLSDERHRILLKRKRRLDRGVAVLASTAATVDVIEKDIVRTRRMHDDASRKASLLLDEVAAREEKLKVIRQDVSQKDRVATSDKADALAIQASAQQDHDSAMPELQNANTSIDSLSRQDVVELRSYTTVSRAVMLVAEAVLILLKERRVDDWAQAKTVFCRPDFIERLRDYDQSTMTQDMALKLSPLISDPEFTPEKVGQTGSYACRSICLWARAVYRFYHMELRVAPKRVRLAEAVEKYEAAKELADRAAADLQDVELELKSLTAAKKTTEQDKADLDAQVALSTQKLSTAEALLAILTPQVARWRHESEVLEKRTAACGVQALLAAAYVAYLGPFPAQQRQHLTRQWLETVGLEDEPFCLSECLDKAATVKGWALQGLCDDSHTLDNALMVQLCCSHRSRRWPLIMDPHNTIAEWVSAVCASRHVKLSTVKMPGKGAVDKEKKHFCEVLEKAMEEGSSLLVTDVDSTIDGFLNPILQKRFQEEPPGSGQYRLFLRPDHTVPYKPSFKLLLSTNAEEPGFSAETWVQANVISFADTPSSCEAHVLDDIVGSVHSDLEVLRKRALWASLANQAKLVGCEDDLLSELQNGGDALLEKTSLVDTLQRLKASKATLEAQMAALELHSAKMAAARKKYADLSAKVSRMYFTARGFSGLQPWYRYAFTGVRSVVRAALRTFAEAQPQMSFSLHAPGTSEHEDSFAPAEDEFALDTSQQPCVPALLHRLDRAHCDEGLSDEELDNLTKSVLRGVFWYFSWSFDAAARRAFVVSLAAASLMSSGDLRAADWRLFVLAGEGAAAGPGQPRAAPSFTSLQLTGSDANDSPAATVPRPSSIEEKAWAALCHIQEAESTGALASLCDAVARRPRKWLEWAKSVVDEDTKKGVAAAPPPTPLSAFQRMLVSKALCPRSAHVRGELFAEEVLGAGFGSSSPDLSETVKWDVPVLFVSAEGADPIPAVRSLAPFTCRLQLVSCGQGQSAAIASIVQACKQTGDWVVVQNAHLASPALQRALSATALAQKAPPPPPSPSPASPMRGASPGLLQVGGGGFETGEDALRPMAAQGSHSFLTAERSQMGRTLDVSTVQSEDRQLSASNDVSALGDVSLNIAPGPAAAPLPPPAGASADGNFRVFLTTTTKAGADVAERTLRLCAKVVYRTEGVRPALQRLYQQNAIREVAPDSAPTPGDGLVDVGGDGINGGPDSHVRCKVMVCLCAYHAVVAARRARSSGGFSSPCEFEDADLSFAAAIFDTALGQKRLDWGALRTVVGDVIYGGRVTDPLDLRVTKAMAEVLLNEDVAEGRAPLVGLRTIPQCDGFFFETMRAFIGDLPPLDTASFLGLSASSSSTQHAHDSAEFLLALAEVQPAAPRGAYADGGGEAGDADAGTTIMDHVNNETVASCALGILTGVLGRSRDPTEKGEFFSLNDSATFTRQGTSRSCSVFTRGSESSHVVGVKVERPFQFHETLIRVTPEHDVLGLHPGGLMRSCVLRETALYNALLEEMDGTLIVLLKVLKGQATSTPAVDGLFRALLYGAVPRQWKGHSYPSCKPLSSWLVDLQQRLQFLTYWMNEGVEKSIWISALYYPKALQGVLVQAYASVRDVCATDVVVRSEVLSTGEPERASFTLCKTSTVSTADVQEAVASARKRPPRLMSMASLGGNLLMGTASPPVVASPSAASPFAAWAATPWGAARGGNAPSFEHQVSFEEGEGDTHNINVVIEQWADGTPQEPQPRLKSIPYELAFESEAAMEEGVAAPELEVYGLHCEGCHWSTSSKALMPVRSHGDEKDMLCARLPPVLLRPGLAEEEEGGPARTSVLVDVPVFQHSRRVETSEHGCTQSSLALLLTLPAGSLAVKKGLERAGVALLTQLDD